MGWLVVLAVVGADRVLSGCNRTTGTHTTLFTVEECMNRSLAGLCGSAVVATACATECGLCGNSSSMVEGSSSFVQPVLASAPASPPSLTVPVPSPGLASRPPAPSIPPPTSPPTSTCFEIMPGLRCIESWIVYLASGVIGTILVISFVLIVVVKSREYCIAPRRHARESRASWRRDVSRHSGDGPLGAALARFAARRRADSMSVSETPPFRNGKVTTTPVDEASSAGLPQGWVELRTVDGSKYYYNQLSKQTSRCKPRVEITPKSRGRTPTSGVVTRSPAPDSRPNPRLPATPASPPTYDTDSVRSLAPDWEEHFDEDGAPYYFHPASGVSAWSRPVNSYRFSNTSQLICDQV